MKLETELMRGAGPIAVLKLLQRRPMYGYELVQALAVQSGGVLAMGQSTLYPLLYNLEAKGLIEAEWQPAQGQSGRDRKYYRLTADGTRRLAEDTRQWGALVAAMSSLGVIGPAASFVPAMAQGGGR